ncbi:type II toxin-antitoxin system Phd/YefM family antitoxin [Streptomyces sp. NPDC015680]|uniref:type II toxin-antitoxin system Phd/YefM family antitoxin n=1 Tax=Streptomyces sp. NPDC015680 TaxID=3364962 RepID=UPI0036FC4C43
MKQMTAEEARRNFADLLNEVGFRGEEVVVTRHGKPIAKLVSAEADESEPFDYEKVAADYAEVLGLSNAPDATQWADALRWFASRIHGGHQSIYAGRDFTERFGVHPYPGDPV